MAYTNLVMELLWLGLLVSMMGGISYGLAFKEDIPSEVTKRVILVLILVIILFNIVSIISLVKVLFGKIIGNVV